MTSIITFTYPQSPYAYKIHSILSLYGVKYSNVPVSRVMPRPELEKIGVNYRRIPVMAVGKDVYCDSQAIIDYIMGHYEGPVLPKSAPIPAMKVLGDNIFRTAMICIPPQALTPEFVKDRAPVFRILDDPDLLEGRMRNHGLSQLRSLFSQLSDSLDTWVCSAEGPTLLDAHIAWSVRWALTQIGVGQEPGFTKHDIPKLWSWLERFMAIECKPSEISGDEAAKLMLSAETRSEKGTAEHEATQFKSGDKVSVNQTDADSTHPVTGTIVSLSVNEVVIAVESGVHVHLPRLGQKIA